MAAITAPAWTPTAAPRPWYGWAVHDGLAVTWRNLKAGLRTPETLVFATIQPIIFVLTFRYVFGGAIQTPGTDYVDFLMPGIFVQTVAFGAITTGIGLSEDLHQGLIERFRSLPMARSAVLTGRSAADLVRNSFVVALMIVVGFLVGFDISNGWPSFFLALVLLMLFAFAMSWVFGFIGLAMPTAEAAQAASFPILAILVFASTAFVPLESMPGWLQAYNKINPVSLTVDAVRLLSIGGDGITLAVFKSALWSIGIIAVFAPLAVRRYRRAV